MIDRFNKKLFISASEFLNCPIVPKIDLHIHTNFTDGRASVEQVFEIAIQAGLETIAFTEHSESWRTNQDGWYLKYVSDIKRCREYYKNYIRAIVGIETNAISFDGQTDLTRDMRENSEYILGAVHRYPELGARKVRDLSAAEAIELEFKALMGLARSKEIDAIAHIGATCSKYCAPFPLSLTREVIRMAANNGIAIEVNSAYRNCSLLEFIEMCAKEDALLALGSNAHGFRDIGLVVRELEIEILNA